LQFARDPNHTEVVSVSLNVEPFSSDVLSL